MVGFWRPWIQNQWILPAAPALWVIKLSVVHNATVSKKGGCHCERLSPTDCRFWKCSDHSGSKDCCLTSPSRSRNTVSLVTAAFLQHAVISLGIYLSIHPSFLNIHPSIHPSNLTPLFRAMFEVDMRERDDGSVTLVNQCPAAVSSFLDFAYSGEALITDGNVDMLFQVSSFLQVELKPPHGLCSSWTHQTRLARLMTNVQYKQYFYLH